MKIRSSAMLCLLVSLSSLSSGGFAADRMQPGQWVGSTTVGPRTFPNSTCVSKSDAEAMNGDARSVQAFVQRTIPPEVCKLSDFKVNGGEVVYTATCGANPAKVITTSYHGDHSEGSDTTGVKTQAKLVGACKS